MVQFCCVVGCGSRSTRERKKFFRLPIVPKFCKNEEKIELLLRRRKQWLDNIDRIDLKDGDYNYSPGYIRVCSDHFCTGMPSKFTDVVNPDWAPTVNMGRGVARIKGTIRKKEMFGIYSSRKSKHATQRPRSREKPKEVDAAEIEKRCRLALSAEKSQRRNTYSSRVKMGKKSVPKKRPTAMQMRVAKKTFMQRKTVMHVKMSEQRKGSDAARSQTTSNLTVVEASDTNPKPAIIHKITVDSIIRNDGAHSSDQNGYKKSSPDTNGVNVLEKISNSDNLCRFVNESTSGLQTTDDEIELLQVIMNEHLDPVKAEFNEELVNETIEELHIKMEIKVEPVFHS